MSEAFPGFSRQAFSFLRQLARNNKREWFTPRKEIFQRELHGPMVRLVELLNQDVRLFAADCVVEPKKAIYRIYRDTRFAKDKTPYKTHLGAMFQTKGLPKNAGAGFYFHIAADELVVAGGMYMPGPDELLATRRAIADDYKTFRSIVESRMIRARVGELHGEKLTRVPKGFDADDPAAEHLRMKQWYFDISLPAKLAASPAVRKEIVSRFKVMAPLVHFLNNAALRAVREQQGEVDDTPRRPAPMF